MPGKVMCSSCPKVHTQFSIISKICEEQLMYSSSGHMKDFGLCQSMRMLYCEKELDKLHTRSWCHLCSSSHRPWSWSRDHTSYLLCRIQTQQHPCQSWPSQYIQLAAGQCLRIQEQYLLTSPLSMTKIDLLPHDSANMQCCKTGYNIASNAAQYNSQRCIVTAKLHHGAEGDLLR